MNREGLSENVTFKLELMTWKMTMLISKARAW